MSRKVKISLVRHGETLSNRYRIMQGQLDTELSDIGRKQARLIALRLQDEPFTHAFSSDLARAADTARAIVEVNKSYRGGLILDRRLRERGFGVLEGKDLAALKEAAAQAKIPMHLYTPNGGETIEQVTERARQFFNELSRMMAQPLITLCDNNLHQSSSKSSSTDSTSAIHDEHHNGAHGIKPLQVKVPVLGDSRNYVSSNGAAPTIAADPLKISSHDTIPPANVLIVSHGLLLRELTQIILSKYVGTMDAGKAKEANHICPNTGLSQFAMSISAQGNEVTVMCTDIHLLCDASHLLTSKEDLVTHAKFQGAL